MQEDGRAFSIGIFLIVVKEQSIIVLRDVADEMLAVFRAGMLEFADIYELVVVFFITAKIHGVR